jgi:site-specific recombinase XerD
MEKVTQGLSQLAEAFFLSKQVAGCTGRTLSTYRWWLQRLVRSVGDSIASVDPVAIQRFFSDLQTRGLSSSSLHQAYRTVKTFFRWDAAIGTLPPTLVKNRK